MRRRLTATVMAACLAASQGCNAGDAERDARSPILKKLQPVALYESDSLYVGKPASLVVDQETGALYVSDGFWGRVLAFSPSGQLTRAYGKRGKGPGEMVGPGALGLVADELLVADVGRSLLVRYSRAGGEFRGAVRYDGALTSITPHGDSVWLGLQNRRRKTSLGVWAAGAPAIRYSGELPREFLDSEPLAGIYNGIQVLKLSDTLTVVGFMGLNRLLRARADGRTVDTMAVPVSRRRGEMKDVVRSLDRLDFPEMFSANSSLFKLHQLPGGSLAAIHYDQKIDGELIKADVFLSILSRDLRAACADHRIEVNTVTQPYTAFRGDTLFVIQQRVDGEKVSAFVDRYLVDEKACPRAAPRKS